MARELRPRKQAAPAAKNGAAKPAKTVVEKTTVKSKRKATDAENESPIPQKIQKVTTKKTITKEPAKKSSKASTPSKKSKAEEPAREDASEEEENEGEEKVQSLAAELDPEEDDSDIEIPEDTVYKPGQPVGVIPDVSQAVEKAAKKSGTDKEPGVIYIGRIPHGFYEHEMRNYFSQFGPINKLILSRNKKTGKSKHFAFVEFAEATTAEIVAKTMNNYLLFGHILKCHTVPAAQVHPNLFKGANKRFKVIPWNKMAGKELEKPLSEAQWEDRVVQEQKKRAKKAAKLKEMGYEFEAPAIKDVPPPAAIEPSEEPKAIEAAPEVEETKEEAKEEAEKTEAKPKSISAPKSKPAAKGKGRKAKA